MLARCNLLTLVVDGGVESIEFIVLHLDGEEILHTLDEVAQDVHVVGKGIIGAVIETTDHVHAHRLGSHVAEIVAGLDAVPILLDAAVLTNHDAAGLLVEFVEGFTLHAITQPATRVTLLVIPADRVGHIHGSHGFRTADDFTGRSKLDATLTAGSGQCLEELKDIAAEGLEDTDGTEFHEEVDDLLLLRKLANPVGIAVAHEGELTPAAVAEAQADIIRELVVTKQETYLGVVCTAIYEMGALPTQHMLGTLGEHTLEAHATGQCTDLITVDETAVAEHLGSLAEEFLDLLALTVYLIREDLLTDERRQSVAVRFGEELHAPCLGEFLQEFDNLGSIVLKKFDGHTRQ